MNKSVPALVGVLLTVTLGDMMIAVSRSLRFPICVVAKIKDKMDKSKKKTLKEKDIFRIPVFLENSNTPTSKMVNANNITVSIAHPLTSRTARSFLNAE